MCKHRHLDLDHDAWRIAVLAVLRKPGGLNTRRLAVLELPSVKVTTWEERKNVTLKRARESMNGVSFCFLYKCGVHGEGHPRCWSLTVEDENLTVSGVPMSFHAL